MDVKVSVVMTSYNHKQYICQAINSVLAQETDFNYEILVGDDASTDGTSELLKSEYKKNNKIRLFLRSRNVGGTRNIYNLYMHAKGQFLCGCECDDYWTDINYLQRMVDWMESHRSYAGVAARRVMLSERTGHKTIKKTADQCNCAISIDDLMSWNQIFDAGACLFVNFFHDGKNDYRFYRMAKHVGDLTLCIYILQHGKVYQLDNVIGVYRMDRVRGASNYNSITSSQGMFLDYINIMKYLEKFCYPELDYSFLQARQAYLYLEAIRQEGQLIKGLGLVIKKISPKALLKIAYIYSQNRVVF